jgi:hypothetical protein
MQRPSLVLASMSQAGNEACELARTGSIATTFTNPSERSTSTA